MDVIWDRWLLVMAEANYLWWLLPIAIAFAYFAWALSRWPGLYTGLVRLTAARGVFWIITLLVVGVALYRAITGAWIGDDAFISFRYAYNLAHGDGLVFNPGEHVEGYTNLLWTLFVALGVRLGASAPHLAVVANLVIFAAHFVVVMLLARKLDPLAKGRNLPPVVTPVMLLGAYAFVTFGTSGLETPLLGLFTTAGLAVFAFGKSWRADGVSGLLLALATLAHPDHLLALAAVGCILSLEGLREIIAAQTGARARAVWRLLGRALAFGLPGLLLLGGQIAFRLWYYGDWLPNTYYAKMAWIPYWSQGAIYGVAFLLGEGYWLIAPLFGLVLLVRGRSTPLWRFTFAALLFIGLMSVYATKIGGDFMYGRLFVSCLAPGWLLLEMNARLWLKTRREQHGQAISKAWLRVGLTGLVALALGFALFQPRLLRPARITHHLADEATYYYIKRWKPLVLRTGMFKRSKALALAVKDIEPKPTIAIRCVGMVAYYTKVPVLDLFGLTDKTIARQPVTITKKRGRPGHERHETAAYMQQRMPEIFKLTKIKLPFRRYRKYMRFHIGKHRFYLSRWNPALVEALESSKAAVSVRDFPRWLKTFEGDLSGIKLKTLKADLAFLDWYYFDHYPEAGSLREKIYAEIERRQARIISKGLGLTPKNGRKKAVKKQRAKPASPSIRPVKNKPRLQVPLKRRGI